MGLLGCRVCGSIHSCDPLTCKEVVETNEGRVCALSGVVVYDKAYSDMEFLDTMALSDSMPVAWDFDGDVETTVMNILSSRYSQALRRKLLCASLVQVSNDLRNSSNLMRTCIKFLENKGKTPYFFDFISNERREQLVLDVINDCRRVIQLMIGKGMSIKSTEVQRITVGLLYLMRCGVTIGVSVILPQRTEMLKLLPPENTLLKAYDIHPKYITETENRLKFSIRSTLNRVA